MGQHEDHHDPGEECSCPGPCSLPAVGAVVGAEGAWRRLYCAEHWPEHSAAAGDFDLELVEFGNEVPRGA